MASSVGNPYEPRLLTDLVNDIIENGSHFTHMCNGENGVEHLPLLPMLVSCRVNVRHGQYSRRQSSCPTHGPKQAGPKVYFIGPAHRVSSTPVQAQRGSYAINMAGSS